MSRTAFLLVLSIGLISCLSACNDDKPGGEETGTTDTDTDDGGEDADNDGYTEAQGDCNDDDPDVNPGAEETCDGIDNDCDDEVDEGVMNTYYQDADDDGFGNEAVSTEACSPDKGWVPNAEDCDDTNADVKPGAEEICDGIDNNCIDGADEGLEEATLYADSDGDGWGDPDTSITTCEEMTGYVTNDLDCDDDDAGEPVIVSQTGPVTTFKGPDSGPVDSADSGVLYATGSGTASSPYESIQKGIDEAAVCVHVYPGTYDEDIDFTGKDITVWGVEGAANTVIDGTGDGPVVTFASGEGPGAILNGFTVQGGGGQVKSVAETDTCGCGLTCTTTTVTYSGGGIYVDSSAPTLESLIVTANELPPYSYTEVSETEFVYIYSFGGGLYSTNGNPSLKLVNFVQNYADVGGGGYGDSGSSLDLTWSIFDENSASAGGGLTSEGAVAMENSILVNNKADSSSASTGGAGLDLQGGTFSSSNITLSGNDGIASIYLGSSLVGVLSNAIMNSNTGGYLVDGETGASWTQSYSDAYNSAGTYGTVPGDLTGADDNISSDPMFVAWDDDDDYSDDDFHLASGSPAIDAGAPSSNDGTDGTRADMGAYGGPLNDW